VLVEIMGKRRKICCINKRDTSIKVLRLIESITVIKHQIK